MIELDQSLQKYNFIKGIFGVGIIDEIDYNTNYCKILWMSNGETTEGNISYFIAHHKDHNLGTCLGHVKYIMTLETLQTFEYFSDPIWYNKALQILTNHTI
jgi:hypothetical protein